MQNWDEQVKHVKTQLDQLGVTYEERPVEQELAGYIEQCGYDPKPLIVCLDALSEVDANLGIVVSHKDQTVNNGIYIFVILRDHTQGLITVIPSTVSKGPMIRRITGDITSAISSVKHPPLTPFDMIEITGQVLVNTCLRDLMRTYNIPKEKETAFLTTYLPKFLANVCHYYRGDATKEGKPLVTEEIADMEPAIVRNLLVGHGYPAMDEVKANGVPPQTDKGLSGSLDETSDKGVSESPNENETPTA